MSNVLRAALFAALMSCSGNFKPPCGLSWEGELTSMGDCNNATPDVLLGSGADVKSLNWQVTSDDATHDVNFLYQVPNPPGDAYEGGTSDEQFCQVTFTPKEAGTPSFTAVSRTSRGSCRISFTSKIDESTGTTKRYTVHGTANATLAAVNDETKTVKLTVTF